MELLLHYFPDLTERQKEQFGALGELYATWNERINVISRTDIGELYLHHVLHSLSIAKVCRFAPGARILDVGTGGGFPGLPLAILFPEARFTLVDSIGKKVRVAQEIAREIGLENLSTLHERAEKVPGRFDFVVSRAVTEMKPFLGWIWDKIDRGARSGSLDNGILYLKGGDLERELTEAGKPYALYPIGAFFGEEFFETKQVVYLPR